MNIEALNELELAVRGGKISSKSELFAGANLIISDDPNRNHYEEDILVVTPHAQELSWLIFQLKSIFGEEIDFMNKFGFYPELGKTANQAISSDADLADVLLSIIERAKDLWSNRPEGLPRRSEFGDGDEGT